MNDEKIGDASAPVAPESFFTDEKQDTPAQQPQPIEANTPTEPPTEEVWDGTKWTFKAAGKQWSPKDRAELMKWASYGVNYDTKARALNQQKSELLAMKEELAAAKEAQDGSSPAKEEDAFSPFSDPNEAFKKQLADMEKRLSVHDSFVQNQESSAMDKTLSEGLEALAKEATMTDEETDELLLEFQGRVDTLPDTAIDTPDKVKRVLRSLYYELHPEAIDEIVEKRATAKTDEVKKSLSGKTVVEGSHAGDAKGSPKPKDFQDAANQLDGVWDSLG